MIVYNYLQWSFVFMWCQAFYLFDFWRYWAPHTCEAGILSSYHFLLGPSWTTILLFMLPALLEWQVHTTTSSLLVEMGSHALFCLGWPQTMIVLISLSWVARINRLEMPWLTMVSILMSAFLSQILFIWVFFLFFLVSLAKGLSTLFIFLKK
jgi:hypothetical protein